ncbi:hypothetical protein DK880_00903 [Candidatus Cardinium hertigii]|uniref:Leucine-binding protein domain-containing protein n=2 Tax=Candidatus Cardinium hertigii TaxID=247481 RepID=A0A2Z3LA36_9BACT|nr:hypothetical protein DK880_00903 [Candidatus Cardinium hertigii]
MSRCRQLKNSRRCAFVVFLWVIGMATIAPLFAARKKEKAATKDSKDPFLIQYAEAKAVYREGNYKKAKIALEALRAAKCPETLRPYVHFYYALTAYHEGDKPLAAQTFNELSHDFPLWDKKEEVYYWIAHCKFQEKHFAEALHFLSLIQNKRMAESVAQMKKYFLSQIEAVSCLQQLAETFDKEVIVKKLLYKKAAYQAYITQDFTLLNQIKQQYNLGDYTYTYDPLYRLVSNRKACYRVAIFFPFFVDEIDYESSTSLSSLVLPLYQGIQLAREALAKEGIALQLFVFDTKGDTSITQALLTQKELPYMDLIIGPFYSDPISLVASFAKQHKINFVNPISSNAAIIQGNPFAFLFQPMLETYAQKAAQLTLSAIQNKSVAEPCIAVFYTHAREDVLQATRYKYWVEQTLRRPLDWFIELSDNAIKDFFAQLNKPDQEIEKEDSDNNNDSKITKEDLAKITHIYIPSKDKLLVSNVINLPFKLGTRPQIIGHEQWIKDEIVTLHQLRKLPFLFLSGCYIDFSRAEVTDFRNKFFQRTATFPTLYSYIGYEMMLFFGRMLATYGTYFQKEWENKPYDGTLLQKINYGKYHANQHITVLHFSGNTFTVAETP